MLECGHAAGSAALMRSSYSIGMSMPSDESRMVPGDANDVPVRGEDDRWRETWPRGGTPTLSLYPGFRGCQVGGPVQQRLTAQAAGDIAGFANCCSGGFGIT